MPDEEANISKVQNLNGKHIRICGRHKPEGICALPGEVSAPASGYYHREMIRLEQRSQQKS